ncbi:MAG: PIN domain-containing protein [Muribaculaceae bacterium]|nr:PIN domain-containing protein [Muribaculaceae bacterium]
MKRLFLDTNFIIDYFVREDFKGDCEKLLANGSERGYIFCVSYLSIANFAFIMRKESKELLLSLIKRICEIFEVIPNNKNQIEVSLSIEAKDYEDVLQYVSAVDGNCDCIITRNEKDYSFSEIPVFPATEFIKKYF